MEDRQGGSSCPWKKFMGICLRKGQEEVSVLPGCPRGRGPAGAAGGWPAARAALQRFCAGLSPFRQQPLED